MSKIWAVVAPDGQAEIKSVNAERQQAIQQFLSLAASSGDEAQTWPELEQCGYLCRCFELVEVPSGEETPIRGPVGESHAAIRPR